MGVFDLLMVFWYWYIQALDPYPSGNPAYDAFIGGIQAATQGIVNVSKILTLRQFNSNVLYINVMFHVTPYISAIPQSYPCVERVEGYGKLWKALYKRKEGSKDCRMLLELWGRHLKVIIFWYNNILSSVDCGESLLQLHNSSEIWNKGRSTDQSKYARRFR